jgi:hypothetical protein
MAAPDMFLDIEKAFDKSGTLADYTDRRNYNFQQVSSSHFLFCYWHKIKVLVKDEFTTHREIVARIPKGYGIIPGLYNLYEPDHGSTRGTHLSLFVDYMCVCVCVCVSESVRESVRE